MMKVVAKRKWKYPLAFERTYSKYLTAHVARMMAVIMTYVPDMRDIIIRYGIRSDADDDSTMVNARMDIIIDEIRKATETSESMRPIVRKMAVQVDRYAEYEFDAIIKSVFGAKLVSVGGSLVKMDAAADDISQLKDMWVQQNLDLITSIDDETMRRIRDKMAERIINNVDSAMLTKYLIEDLKDIASVETKRAALIGSDQVGKLNGMITQHRQQNAGIGEYKWHTCLDSRVRPRHIAREGHIYKWSSPPPDGHPGHPIRCRCVALPVIDLDSIAAKPKGGSVITAKTTNAQDYIAGIKRGKPMSLEEANGLKANPNFELGGGYCINCQSCVVTFEARIRGFNVETLANTKGSMLNKLASATYQAWQDKKTGKQVEYSDLIIDNSITNAKQAYQWLNKELKIGARYDIGFQWKGRRHSGHIITIRKLDNGIIEMYDPQRGVFTSGEKDVVEYLKRIKYYESYMGHKIPINVELLRVDDKDFYMPVCDKIMKGTD